MEKTEREPWQSLSRAWALCRYSHEDWVQVTHLGSRCPAPLTHGQCSPPGPGCGGSGVCCIWGHETQLGEEDTLEKATSQGRMRLCEGGFERMRRAFKCVIRDSRKL